MNLPRRLAQLLTRRRHATLLRSGRAPQDDPMPQDFPDAGKQAFGDREKRTNRRESW